jgi:hypothetical protein
MQNNENKMTSTDHKSSTSSKTIDDLKKENESFHQMLKGKHDPFNMLKNSFTSEVYTESERILDEVNEKEKLKIKFTESRILNSDETKEHERKRKKIFDEKKSKSPEKEEDLFDSFVGFFKKAMNFDEQKKKKSKKDNHLLNLIFALYNFLNV